MKKLLCVFLATLMIALGGCSNSDNAAVESPNTSGPLVRMIKIDGEIYCDTGKESSLKGRCGVMDGQITSCVEQTEIPTEDNQSNFDKDFGYQIGMTENQIEICYKGRWEIFEKNSECEGLPLNWGITLTAKDVTQSGLTLVCTQKGGKYEGILQTGSPFRLEKKNNGVWEKVEYFCRTDFDFAWTSEAWIINENGTTEWEVDWEWLYGMLPEGEYRLGKEITDFVKPNENRKGTYFVYFTIK